MNIFQFKHVGNGLFYTGSIADEFNFVYDCGTASNDKSLYDEIYTIRHFTERKHIDFVVISHLNESYFNGLYDLCSEYRVNKIYLPYLGENKELIRLMLINTIFKNAVSKSDEDRLRLYAFMCNLYNIDTDYGRHKKLRKPKHVIILAPRYAKSRQSNESGVWVHNAYPNIEISYQWMFVFITKMLKNEEWSRLDNSFRKAYAKYYTDEGFNSADYERKLLSYTKNSAGIEILRTSLLKLCSLYIEYAPSDISSILLLHYPKMPRCATYLNEYKSYNQGYLQSPQKKVEGMITLLMGDVRIDKQLEDLIFNCGDFSCGGGVLQIPASDVAKNRNAVMSLARPFKAFVRQADNDDAAQDERTILPELAMYPYQYVRSATQSTGITYFIE